MWSKLDSTYYAGGWSWWQDPLEDNFHRSEREGSQIATDVEAGSTIVSTCPKHENAPAKRVDNLRKTYSSIHGCVSNEIYEMNRMSLCRHGLGGAIEIIVAEQAVGESVCQQRDIA